MPELHLGKARDFRERYELPSRAIAIAPCRTVSRAGSARFSCAV